MKKICSHEIKFHLPKKKYSFIFFLIGSLLRPNKTIITHNRVSAPSGQVSGSVFNMDSISLIVIHITNTIFVLKIICYVPCVCSGYNTRSDWLILRQSSPVMPTGRLRCCKAMAFYNLEHSVLCSHLVA